jgi:hypothetical protein
MKELKIKETKRHVAILNTEVNMLLQGKCFIFRTTITLVCEVYARSRFAPLNIPHAGEKRGQENKSYYRSSLRF